jgi:hypothetical protein
LIFINKILDNKILTVRLPSEILYEWISNLPSIENRPNSLVAMIFESFDWNLCLIWPNLRPSYAFVIFHIEIELSSWCSAWTYLYFFQNKYSNLLTKNFTSSCFNMEIKKEIWRLKHSFNLFKWSRWNIIIN